MLVRDLGLKNYEEVWALQKKLVFECGHGDVPDTVILCQHHAVYTIGRSSKQCVPTALPYPVHAVERGGDLTWHGPGQLVGYPILNLRRQGLSARTYLRSLEAVLIESISPFGILATTVKGFTGLWVGRQKIASIGVAVKNGISYHGFALNINNSLSAFRLIYPCKLESEVMTSMSAVLGHNLDENIVTAGVGRTLLHYFGRKQVQ